VRLARRFGVNRTFSSQWQGRKCERGRKREFPSQVVRLVGFQIDLIFWLLFHQGKSNKSYPRNSTLPPLKLSPINIFKRLVKTPTWADRQSRIHHESENPCFGQIFAHGHAGWPADLNQNPNQFHIISPCGQITAHGLAGRPADLERTGIFPARWRGRMCEKENSGWQIGLTFWLLLGQAKSNKSNPRNSWFSNRLDFLATFSSRKK
jgi:hypothetical protein